MAFINQEKKRELTPIIKQVFKEYGFKGSICICNYSTLIVTLTAGPLDLINDADSEPARDLMRELTEAMNTGNPDHPYNNDSNSNQLGWNTIINVGRWNRPFEVTRCAITNRGKA